MIDLGTAEAAARRSIWIGTMLALTGAMSYGVNIVFARMASGFGISGSDIVVYRALISTVLLGSFLVLSGRKLGLQLEGRITRLRFAFFAALTALFYLTSLNYLPVSVSVAIFYTYPLVVLLVTPYLDRVRLPLRRRIVAILAFAGVAIAVGPQLEGLDPRGLVLAMAASLCCSGMFVTGSRLTGDSIVTLFWCQIVAVPIAFAFALLTGGLTAPSSMLVAIWPLAIVIVTYLLGFLFQILASARISAATAGLLFLLEPVTAILGSVVVLGEHVTHVQMFGMLLVVGALAYDVWPRAGAAPASPDRP